MDRLARRAPLADRLRPTRLDDIVGQEHLLGPGRPMRALIEGDRLSSVILWGPPGTGKTTLARVIARTTAQDFTEMSAVSATVKDVRELVVRAADRLGEADVGTILFLDEVHRFNKAQQDAFLPYVERGDILLIGATTENPSFELNAALLSRSQVLTLERLTLAEMERLTQRAEQELGRTLPLDGPAREAMQEMADGDGRALLNLVEQAASWKVEGKLDTEGLSKRLMRRAAKYDKSGDEHYNLISALHKSIRGSDPDAAIYWLARMLEGGEDPRYLFRRLSIMAVEDISLADPQAQSVCLDAWQLYERIGQPEGELALAQVVIYLALAPKTNSSYKALSAAKALARQTGSAMPPKHIINAPTRMMKDQGFGRDYQYDHDAEDGFSGQNYFPEGVERPTLYQPVERGFERELKKRAEYFARLRAKRQTGG